MAESVKVAVRVRPFISLPNLRTGPKKDTLCISVQPASYSYFGSSGFDLLHMQHLLEGGFSRITTL